MIRSLQGDVHQVYTGVAFLNFDENGEKSAIHKEQILGKPKDEQEAFDMIRSLQGDVHQVYTGVAFLNFDENGEKSAISHAVETKVYVNPMSTEEIEKYVESKEPMDKAGAYGIQGKFSAFIEKIEGDYFNVVGLPVSYVYQVLKYVESKEPMDKAGAYGIQGKFSAFIEKIEGDYFNVVGLPVSYVYQVLKELGE